MADSSNFVIQRTRFVSDEVSAVGDGLLYFSQNCHFGIFFGLACVFFLNLFRVVAVIIFLMFNLAESTCQALSELNMFMFLRQ